MSSTGRVVKALSEDRWIINLGLEQGIEANQRFVIFELGEEILDPESGESLGALELVKGHAQAEHVQPRMSILILEKKAAAPAAPRVLSAVLADTTMGAKKKGRRGRDTPKSQSVQVGDSVRAV